MIHNPIRLLKLAVHFVLGKLGYRLVKLPKDRPVLPALVETPRTEPLVRTISDFSTSPVELYVRKHYEMFRTGHFDCVYPEWRVRRIRKVLELEGTDFKGKRLLELGGGIGDIGAFFAELGAEVTSAEGRIANVNFANIKYRHIPTFKSIQRDLEKDFSDLGKFDLVLSFGSLEVIDNVASYIKSCCALSENTLFETGVTNSDDPILYLSDKCETPIDLGTTDDHTMSGHITPVSGAYIERKFTELGFSTKRVFDGDMNCGENIYDWNVGDDYGGKTTRRFWKFTK